MRNIFTYFYGSQVLFNFKFKDNRKNTESKDPKTD